MGSVTIQEVNVAEYVERICSLDTSFTADAMYNVVCYSSRITLEKLDLDEPQTKRLPIEDLRALDKVCDFASVAIARDHVCGFIAGEHSSWNRRFVIRHLYVDSAWRRRGVARLLLKAAEAYAERQGVVHLWLETSSVNAPAIHAYQRLGFELCGVDTTLYLGTPASGESALFFSRPVKLTEDKNNCGNFNAN